MTTQSIAMERHYSTWRGAEFVGLTAYDVVQTMASMRVRLDEMAVLRLWLVFERFIIDYVASRSNRLAAALPTTFGVELTAKVANAIEYWPSAEVLDLFKGWIASEEIGRIKQIRSYRNWIAHRNEKQPSPVVLEPQAVAEILGAMMDTVFAGDRPQDAMTDRRHDNGQDARQRVSGTPVG